MQLKKLTWAVTVLLLAVGLASCNIGKKAASTTDVNTIYTSAAGTMIAQLNDQQTQTAQAIPPTSLASPTALDTFTPLPTFPIAPGTTPFIAGTPLVLNTPLGGLTPLASPQPGAVSYPVGCNDATFTGGGIFYKGKWHRSNNGDGTVIDPGDTFLATWDFTNSGTCNWDEGYMFGFKSGDRLQGRDTHIVFKGDFVKAGQGVALNQSLTVPLRPGEYKGYWQMKGDNGQWFGSLVWVDVVVQKP